MQLGGLFSPHLPHIEIRIWNICSFGFGNLFVVTTEVCMYGVVPLMKYIVVLVSFLHFHCTYYEIITF